MKRCVVKASNIYYLNLDQPGRLIKIAEEYYQRAEECEQKYSFLKARVYYQKAEECFQKARDVYKARKQADKAKRQADEARIQADEARRQAGEAKEQASEGDTPQMATHRIYRSQPAMEYQTGSLPTYRQPVTRPKPPAPQYQAPQTSLGRTPAQISLTSQEEKETPKIAVNHSTQCTDGVSPQQNSAIQGIPNNPEKKANRPISWKGKRHN